MANGGPQRPSPPLSANKWPIFFYFPPTKSVNRQITARESRFCLNESVNNTISGYKSNAGTHPKSENQNRLVRSINRDSRQRTTGVFRLLLSPLSASDFLLLFILSFSLSFPLRLSSLLSYSLLALPKCYAAPVPPHCCRPPRTPTVSYLFVRY